MTSGPPANRSPTAYAQSHERRQSGSPGEVHDPQAGQQRPSQAMGREIWGQQATASRVPVAGYGTSDRFSGSYSSFSGQRRPSDEEWGNRPPSGYQDAVYQPAWPTSPLSAQFPAQSPIPSSNGSNVRSHHSGWAGSWPAPLLRRTSSDDTSLKHYSQSYYTTDMSSSVPTISGHPFPQRRSSNRDEFDDQVQFLEKPANAAHEPKEDDMPQLPVSLHGAEQDDILGKVNDRLSQCAYDFVAKYQFPIPLEADKRPVRIPSDREWSEWVYLLKRLATKRRIPSRILFNQQIKQLITILENSLEMRHAAKHQSRPLKDDFNILQLISSGLQVAKMLKDGPAVEYLLNLYRYTGRLIQSRQGGPNTFSPR